jgi:hypothetical protein
LSCHISNESKVLDSNLFVEDEAGKFPQPRGQGPFAAASSILQRSILFTSPEPKTTGDPFSTSSFVITQAIKNMSPIERMDIGVLTALFGG